MGAFSNGAFSTGAFSTGSFLMNGGSSPAPTETAQAFFRCTIMPPQAYFTTSITTVIGGKVTMKDSIAARVCLR